MGNIDLKDYGKNKNLSRKKHDKETIKRWRKKLGWDKIPYLK
jgi:hypothetical protein